MLIKVLGLLLLAYCVYIGAKFGQWWLVFLSGLGIYLIAATDGGKPFIQITKKKD